MGDSGAVTKVDRRGHQSRIAEGLASLANTPLHDNAIGPHRITVLGDERGLRDQRWPHGARRRVGHADLARRARGAEPGRRPLRPAAADPPPRAAAADRATSGLERDVNPDATVGNPAIDSNAVDVLADRWRFVAADAGGNAINVVRPWGSVSNLAVFPNRLVPNPFAPGRSPMQAVPTSVELGPDHQYYVGQLTGFPFPVGGANVYRVDPRSGEVGVFASGFTNIMDLAFGRDGTLYVLEIDHDGLLGGDHEGALYAVSRDGTKRQIELPAGTLPMPGGLAVGRHALYVTTNSGSPDNGQVVRIRTGMRDR